MLNNIGKQLLRDQLANELSQETDNINLIDRILNRYLPNENTNNMGNNEVIPYSFEGNNMAEVDLNKLANSTVVQDANGRWSSNDPFAQSIINIESRGKANAYNKSGASGLYQFVPSTARAYKLNDPFNAEQSHQAFIKLVQDNAKTLSKYGVPITAEYLWTAHNLGAKGAKEVYEYMTQGKPVSNRTLKYIKANGGFDNPSDYFNHWSQRLSGNIGG